jgi:hypothetical protein
MSFAKNRNVRSYGLPNAVRAFAWRRQAHFDRRLGSGWTQEITAPTCFLSEICKGFPASKPALTRIAIEPNYDVAISFLAKDEPIAKDLYDRPIEVLKVF